MTTLRDTLRAAEQRLRDLRVRDAEAEGRVLLAHVLDDTLSHLPTRLSEEASPELQAQLDALLERRLHHEPLAYITGSTEFMGLPFLCDRRALIPRADTETLVETALAKLRAIFPAQPGRMPLISDLGTGSGCIGIAIAHALPQLRVVATDVSCEAVELAAWMTGAASCAAPTWTRWSRRGLPDRSRRSSRTRPTSRGPSLRSSNPRSSPRSRGCPLRAEPPDWSSTTGSFPA